MQFPKKFKPESVISEKEFSSLFGMDDAIELGTVTSLSTEDIIKLTDIWVSRMDDFILKSQQRNIPQYTKLLLRYRAFTYHEFKLLFKEIPQEKYKHYPIFQFLRIPSADFLVERRLAWEESPSCFCSGSYGSR